MPKNMENKERTIIKIGSSTITNSAGELDDAFIENIAKQVASMRKSHEVAIVTSGAVAAGKSLLKDANGSIIEKQVEAAFGQPYLMASWINALKKYDLRAAQFLLTGDDLDRPTLPLLRAMEYGIPIINANDVANDAEMRQYMISADNDRLAGYVAGLIKADNLILLTEADGVWNENKHVISEIKQQSDLDQVYLRDKTGLGTGGMGSKLEVAIEASRQCTGVWIANGRSEDIIERILGGEQIGTRIYNLNI